MPIHPDALGYLADLANDVNEPWFRMFCDMASGGATPSLSNAMLTEAIDVYIKTKEYGAKVAADITSTPMSGTSPVDFIEYIRAFNNFKRLGNELRVDFSKQVSLIFGTNGSGKSSICESLKVLATLEPPLRPLHNLRGEGGGMPEFRYKFMGDSVEQLWLESEGFGPRRATVKHFDAAVANKNVRAAIEPGSVVELTPFKLFVFESVKSMTFQLRDALQRVQKENSDRLSYRLAAIRQNFARFPGYPLASISESSLHALVAQIEIGEKFNGHQNLNEKRMSLKELERAGTEDGLRLLRAEHRELEGFIQSVGCLISAALELWVIEPANKVKELATKESAQREIVSLLAPEGQTSEALLALLRAAAPLCPMHTPDGYSCPLCKRNLGAAEIDLFKSYNELLIGELERRIGVLRGDILKAHGFVNAINRIDRVGWKKQTTVAEDIVASVTSAAEIVVSNCGLSVNPTEEAYAAIESLMELSKQIEIEATARSNAIDVATTGRLEVVKEIARIQNEIMPLDYELGVSIKLAELKETLKLANIAGFWMLKIPGFIPLLKKITTKAKEAYEGLVVADFELRLDAEYKYLTEKKMIDFGVKLARKGNDATVTVLPQIGGKEIDSVLSEGEQRVHALALFLAELETCSHSVLVFDDPISSFDYNHVANFCIRIRDFAIKYPERQVIVLTHNWEFFVHIQGVLNKAQLTHRLSVQVLENCASLEEYSEKIVELKGEINKVLNHATEPSRIQKETTAGNMRRLIEAVVNTHVFNHQRRQYKQRSQPVSEFLHYTKVVPLLPSEALILRDLYEKLSITEHDDPRSAYVNTDKATFTYRYDAIVEVETAILARKP